MEKGFNDRSSKFRLAIIIYAIASIGLAIVIILLSIYFSDNGNNVNLIGTDKLGKSYNNDQLADIKRSLFTIIQKNTDKSKHDISAISDAYIREKSITTIKDESSTIVRFLVDIPSLKQSYRAQYTYTEGKRSSTSVSDNETSVECPNLSELIYGDFSCKDNSSIQQNETDPLLKLLPYDNPVKGFRISKTNDGSIEIFSYSCLDKNATKAQQTANAWLKNKGIKLENYTVIYTACETE
jgi:hypothetical protein